MKVQKQLGCLWKGLKNTLQVVLMTHMILIVQKMYVYSIFQFWARAKILMVMKKVYQNMNLRLNDYYVSSSFNSIIERNMVEGSTICSIDILLRIIRSGCRFFCCKYKTLVTFRT